MRTLVAPASKTPTRSSRRRSGIVLLLLALGAGVVRAETPDIGLWCAEGQEAYTTFDVLSTSQWYPATRKIWLNAWVQNPSAGTPVAVNDLVAAFSLPPSLSVYSAEFGGEQPFYAQWNAASTSMIYRVAAPLTNEEWWTTSLDLAAGNGWAQPKIQVERSAYPLRVDAGQSVTQQVVITLFIPPDALLDSALLSLQPDLWGSESSGITVEPLASVWPAEDFQFDPLVFPPTYYCTYPFWLSGYYSFTNTVRLTNTTETDMNVMPGVQITYSEDQSAWPEAGVLSAQRENVFTSGIAVRASLPSPALWHDQYERGRTTWVMRGKWAPADADQPSLSQAMLFRSSGLGYDGQPCFEFFLDGEGLNLAAASISTPDNTTYAVEVDASDSTCNFELVSRSANDLERFTNGVYTIRLYDITNGLRQIYTPTLAGAPVTSVPQLLSPAALCITNPQPTLAWRAADDPAVNTEVLIVENVGLGEDFMLWTDASITNYQVSSDLFGGVGYQLFFANAASTNQDGANFMSGYLAARYGLFNVTTNGEQGVAFVRSATSVPRIFAGQELGLRLFDFGFLPGTNYTFATVYGDGAATNVAWSSHTYAEAGEYVAQVVVTDEFGTAATGNVTAVVHPLPRLSRIGFPDSATAELEFPTIDGAFYFINASESIEAPDWGWTVSFLIGDGTTNTVQDLDAPYFPRRFYRLECDLNPSEIIPMGL